jgi:3'-5' exoribonuclease
MATKRAKTEPIVKLCDLQDGQMGDVFVLFADRESLTTRDGKPYFRVTFRDAGRQVSFPVWNNSPLFAACAEEWKPGEFYKLRGIYRETSYGPQLDIEKIREIVPEDADEGFDPADFFERTRFDIEAMYAELVDLAESQISDKPLRGLVLGILEEHAAVIKQIPAATHNHHAYVGGYVEHVLSVTKTAVYLAEKYATYYDTLQPPLDRSLVVAGAVLHDVGKIFELELHKQRYEYSAAGRLIGHILMGRDMVRKAAESVPDLDPDRLLRLEHVIVAHQNLAEWGSPKSPHTLEALIVHYADDLDAKLQMMAQALESDRSDGPFTSRHNPLRRHVYRGPVAGPERSPSTRELFD